MELVDKKAKTGFILGIVAAGLDILGWFFLAILCYPGAIVVSIIGICKSAKGLKANGKYY